MNLLDLPFDPTLRYLVIATDYHTGVIVVSPVHDDSTWRSADNFRVTMPTALIGLLHVTYTYSGHTLNECMALRGPDEPH